MTAAPEDDRFAVLDGMRGLAALVVITDHVYSETLTGLLPGRYLAVDFFFALSGFILAHVYGRRLADGLSFVSFMRARVVRLYPLYLLGTLIGAAALAYAAAAGARPFQPSQIAVALPFALVWLPTPTAVLDYYGALFPLNGPAWSLFFEIAVNAAFALLPLRLNRVALLAIVVVSGALLIPIALAFGRLDVGFSWTNFAAGFPRVAYGFFVGVLVYRMRGVWRIPALPAWAPFLGLLAVFMIPAPGGPRPIYELVAVLVLMPALVAVAAETRVSGRAYRLCVLLGLLSYGIYALHVPLWNVIELTLDASDVRLPGAALVLLVAATATGAAAAAHWLYDAPVRRRLSRPRAPAVIGVNSTR